MEHRTRAGFWIRTLALLLDTLFILPLAGLLFAIYYWGEQRGYSEAALERWTNLLITPLALAYWSMEIFKAASPGTMILKLRITNGDGTDALRSRLTMRWLTKNSPLLWSFFASLLKIPALELVSSINNLLVFISCLMVLRESKLAWHDEWAGTAVFRPARLAEDRGFEPIMQPPVEQVTMPPPPVEGGAIQDR